MASAGLDELREALEILVSAVKKSDVSPDYLDAYLHVAGMVIDYCRRNSDGRDSRMIPRQNYVYGGQGSENN